MAGYRRALQCNVNLHLISFNVMRIDGATDSGRRQRISFVLRFIFDVFQPADRNFNFNLFYFIFFFNLNTVDLRQ